MCPVHTNSAQVNTGPPFFVTNHAIYELISSYVPSRIHEVVFDAVDVSANLPALYTWHKIYFFFLFCWPHSFLATYL